MWKKLNSIKALPGLFARQMGHNSRYPKSTWREVDQEEELKFRVSNSSNTTSKKSFQNRMEYLLSELKRESPTMPETENPDFRTSPSFPTHPLISVIRESTNALPLNFIDSRSEAISSDDELKREFLCQKFLCHEARGKFAEPDSQFQCCSMEEVDKCLADKPYFKFVMNKYAKRMLTKEKRAQRIKERTESEVEYNERFDAVPTYTMKKRLPALASYRQERNRLDENPLIFDMGFESLMNVKHCKSTVRQLEYVMTYNISHTTPFRVIYVNMPEDSLCYQEMLKRGAFGFPDYLMSVTEKSLTEIEGVEAEDLVYLSPDASMDMTTFDYSKAYVIGGLVDCGAAAAMKSTYNIAKRIGIQKVKFPLKKYLLWGNATGRDELTLDVAFKILHTFRDTNNWPKAFMHVPKRFHKGLTSLGKEAAQGDPEVLHWYDNISIVETTPTYDTSFTSADFLGWS